jgi:hypothetical protein
MAQMTPVSKPQGNTSSRSGMHTMRRHHAEKMLEDQSRRMEDGRVPMGTASLRTSHSGEMLDEISVTNWLQNLMEKKSCRDSSRRKHMEETHGEKLPSMSYGGAE